MAKSNNLATAISISTNLATDIYNMNQPGNWQWQNQPTWQLTMTGQLTFVPSKAAQMASKSHSRGEDELQIGIRLWTLTKQTILNNFTISFNKNTSLQ
jgi:hypothetical protein